MAGWHLTHSEPVLTTPWLTVLKNGYISDTGTVVPDYYIVERPNFVLVIAEHAGRVLLLRQYRPATNQSYLALPAGYLNEDETPLQAAERELEEETGYGASAFRQIGELHPLPGYVRSTAYVVQCDPDEETPIHGVDAAEVDELVWMNWSEILGSIRNGSINEMQAVSALLLGYLNRP